MIVIRLSVLGIALIFMITGNMETAAGNNTNGLLNTMIAMLCLVMARDGLPRPDE